MTTDLFQQQKLCDALVAQETHVWDALVRGDAEADAAMLHPAFLGVYPDGFATASEHAAQLYDGPTIAQFELTQARAMTLGEGFALLSYCATYQRPAHAGTERMYVSSIWQQTDQGWRNVFSQDTPAKSV